MTQQPGFAVVDAATAAWHPLKRGGGRAALLLSPEQQTGSTMRVSLVERPPGSEPGPYHLHRHCRTLYVVLEGAVVFGVAEEIVPAGADAGVFIEAGVPHCVHNVGDGTARLICLFDTYMPEDFSEVDWPEWERRAKQAARPQDGVLP